MDEQARTRSEILEWASRGTAKRKAPAAPARNAPVPQPRSREPEGVYLPADALDSAASAVRGALKRAAREQKVMPWSELRRQLGSALPRMTVADRVEVLILVDEAGPADQVLLSALVAAGDPELLPHYRQIAAALGLEPPDDDGDLRDALEADVRQAQDAWRFQFRPVPSRGTGSS